MKRWFVTGTDTEVGKTAVTACLAQAARSRGSVIAAKPVASGVEVWPGEDAALIAEAAGHPPCVFMTYRAPLSPHRAAILEDRAIDLAGLRQFLDNLAADTVLVEGVGGWAVPLSLTPRYEVSDLYADAGGSVIVVAANRLGVLNHTRLTIRALRAEAITPALIVLNRSTPGTDRSSETNHLDLDALLDVPVVAMPHVDLTNEVARKHAGDLLWQAIC